MSTRIKGMNKKMLLSRKITITLLLLFSIVLLSGIVSAATISLYTDGVGSIDDIPGATCSSACAVPGCIPAETWYYCHGNDDECSYVRNSFWHQYKKDLYSMQNYTGDTGNVAPYIVTVFLKGTGVGDISLEINSSGTTSSPSTFFSYDDGTWHWLSYGWSTDPNTGGSWTWDAINNLEAGVGMYTHDTANALQCTQVYLLITYYEYSNSTTQETQSITNTTSTLRGYLDSDGGNAATCGFWINNDSTVDHSNNVQNVTCSSTYTTGQYFTKDVTGLTPGRSYFVRSWNKNGVGFNYSSTVTSFITEPNAPTNFSIDYISPTNVNMSWTKGTYANNTVVVRKIDVFPSSVTDGTVIYNNTGTWYNDSVAVPENHVYYYRAWSWATWTESGETLNTFSSTYDDGYFTGLIISTYNETDASAISNWSVFISNHSGTKVYNETNCNNPHTVFNDSVPYGDNTMIEISKDGYKSRIYYKDLSPGGVIFFNAYLPPEGISELYLLQVKNEIDIVVPGVHLQFKHYINATIGFGNVSSLVTDGEGQVNIYLIPGQLYKIIITAEGYDTGISDYYPSDSIFTHTLRIYFSNGTGTPKEYLFDNIGWGIIPTEPYQTGAFNVSYSISSTDSKIEWFNATVHEYNSSSETWVLLYAENITDQPTGGTIQYTINNETGKYSFTCRFKKEGFPVYTFGTEESCRIYYIYLPDRGWGIENIPSFIYMLITIVLMIGATGLLAMGLLAMVGAGEASGFGGMGVMAIMFTVNPSLLIGGISCWFVLLVAVIVYGAFLFVTKG
jgi:hypothetical protein